MGKNTLHLNVTKKWFDMLLSGEKKEEYREIKKFWFDRLLWFKTCVHYWERLEVIELSWTDSHDYKQVIEAMWNKKELELKDFDTITFSNGMKPVEVLPRFEVEFTGFEIREGEKKWGAKDGEKYFVLKVGEIISRSNC